MEEKTGREIWEENMKRHQKNKRIIAKMYKDGAPIGEICKTVKASRQAVYEVIRKHVEKDLYEKG
jgi:predicted DNA-binding protein YlxM (UPF0122 family)